MKHVTGSLPHGLGTVIHAGERAAGGNRQPRDSPLETASAEPGSTADGHAVPRDCSVARHPAARRRSGAMMVAAATTRIIAAHHDPTVRIRPD